MNFFITDNEGLHYMTLVDFKFLQDAYLEGFGALAQALMPTGTPGCILTGCELSEDGVSFDLSPGFVYWQGEIFFTPAASGSYAFGDTPVLTITEGYLSTDPVEYASGVKHYVHKTRIMVFSFEAGLPADAVAFGELPLMEETLLDKLGLSDHEQRLGVLETDHEDRLEALETDAQLTEVVVEDHQVRIEDLEASLLATEQDLLTLMQEYQVSQAELTQAQQDIAVLDAQLQAVAEYTVPIGAIVMTGDVSEFDGNGTGITGSRWYGWQLCNGLNGTEDMTARFVVGWSGTAASDYEFIGTTGGEVLTYLAEENLPAHSHTFGMVPNDGTGKSLDGGGNDAYQKNPLDDTALTGEVGSNIPFENRPPYIVMAYVQRIF